MSDATVRPQPSGGALLPPARARAARRAADQVRAQALVSVASGEASIWDVLARAATPSGRPLLRLSLHQLLIAQPGVGTKSARSRVASLLDLVRSATAGESQRALTVQWLIDPRAHGRRMLAFIEVMDEHTGTPPWRGFPLAPPITAGNVTATQGARP